MDMVAFLKQVSVATVELTQFRHARTDMISTVTGKMAAIRHAADKSVALDRAPSACNRSRCLEWVNKS